MYNKSDLAPQTCLADAPNPSDPELHHLAVRKSSYNSQLLRILTDTCREKDKIISCAREFLTERSVGYVRG